MLSNAGRHLGRSGVLDYKLPGLLQEPRRPEEPVCVSVMGGILDALEGYGGSALQASEPPVFQGLLEKQRDSAT